MKMRTIVDFALLVINFSEKEPEIKSDSEKGVSQGPREGKRDCTFQLQARDSWIKLADDGFGGRAVAAAIHVLRCSLCFGSFADFLTGKGLRLVTDNRYYVDV